MSADPLDATFAALADPTRRAILARLATGDATVTELSAPFAMSQPAVSKHLKVLERAGLIARGRAAQRRPRRLVVERLADATEWLERHRRIWEDNYRRLDALLDAMKLEASTAAPAPDTAANEAAANNRDVNDHEANDAPNPSDGGRP